MKSNTIQTNTFTGGMNRDSAEHAIKADLYQYAENITIMADENSTFTNLQPREHIYKYNSVLPLEAQILGTVITKINVKGVDEDCLIVITREGNRNKVYRIVGLDTDRLTIKDNGPYINADLNITTDCEVIGNVESKDISKVYIVDGVNLLRCIDVNSDKPLNVTDASQFDAVPELAINQPQFAGYIGGALPAGKVLYFVRVFHKNGNTSILSTGSALIPIVKDPSITAANGLKDGENSHNGVKITVDLSNIPTYFEYIQVYRAHYINDSDEPVISLINETRYSGSLVTISDISDSSVTKLSTDEFLALAVNSINKPQIMESFGNNLFLGNITELLFELDNPDSDNWYDTRAYRCNSTGSVKLNSSSAGSSTYNIVDLISGDVKVPYEHDCINPINSNIGGIDQLADNYVYGKVGDKYVLGGSGPNVSYRFIYAEIAPTNVTCQSNRLNDDVFTYKGSATTSKGITLLYGDKSLSSHSILSGVSRIPNYSDPAVCVACTGYQRDEVYAFGVVFYNKRGLKSAVHWIADIKMPAGDRVLNYIADKDLVYPFKSNTTTLNYTGSNIDLVGYALGIEFTFKNLPEEVVRYEIVRCDRTSVDKTIVSQGILSNIWGQLEVFKEKSNSWSLPWAWPFFNNSNGNYKYDKDENGGITASSITGGGTITLNRVSNTFEYISPEGCFSDNSNDLLRGGLLKQIKCIASHNTNGVIGFKFGGINKEVTVKVPVSDLQTRTIKPAASSSNNGPSLQSPCISTMKYYLVDSSTNVYYNRQFDVVDSITGRIDIDQVDLRYVDNYDSLTQNILEWDYINVTRHNGFGDNDVWSFAAHGKNNILKLKNHSNPGDASVYKNLGYTGSDNNFKKDNVVPVCNVYKTDTVLYLGDTFAVRSNRTYISTGTVSSNESCACFGGDTYLCILDHLTASVEYFTGTKWDHHDEDRVTVCINSLIPLESTYNIDLRNDDSFTKLVTSYNSLQSAYLIANGPRVTDYYVQETELYKYNSVYSADPTLISYIPTDLYNYNSNVYSNRVLASNTKVNNEVIDSWLQYKYANYLDIDFNHGYLTNLKLFNSKMYYFTDTSFGTVSVNDRSLITDQTGAELILGTGTLLNRYDQIIDKNGSCIIRDKSIVTSDSAIYWYDPTANEICRFGNGFVSLSKSKLVLTDLNALSKHERDDIVENKRSNGLFDKKYNEIWMKVGKYPIIFSERLDVFTSYYTHEYSLSVKNIKYPLTISENLIYYINTLNEGTLNKKVDRQCKLTYVINVGYPNTKVYDYVWFAGVLDKDTIKDINFITKTLLSLHLDLKLIECREDNYRFYIPRELSTEELTLANMAFPGRMRGKYMLSNFTMDCNDKLFLIPYINTMYRVSAL